jgi:hypothetical protein
MPTYTTPDLVQSTAAANALAEARQHLLTATLSLGTADLALGGGAESVRARELNRQLDALITAVAELAGAK